MGFPKAKYLPVIITLALSACGGTGTDSSSTPLPSSATRPTTPSSSGTVTLSWIPPTQNMDGSYLTDLAGYNVYYGFAEDSYSTRIHIDNPGIATYVVTNLAPNTYYFVATSYNSNGIESPYSKAVMRVVN